MKPGNRTAGIRGIRKTGLHSADMRRVGMRNAGNRPRQSGIRGDDGVCGGIDHWRHLRVEKTALAIAIDRRSTPPTSMPTSVLLSAWCACRKASEVDADPDEGTELVDTNV